MSTIKSHERKKFGISYDFGYFTEDNVLESAQNSLFKGEYSAAREAFEYILEKYPHDFEALKGLILCDNEWKSIHPILHMSKVSIKEYTPSLTHALNNCLPEHRPYFLKIVDLLRIKNEYRKVKDELKKLEAQKSYEDKIRQSLLDTRKSNDRNLSDVIRGLRSQSSGTGISYFDISAVVYILCIIAGTVFIGSWFLIVSLLIPLLAAVIYIVRKEIRNELIDSEIEPHNKKIISLEEEYDRKILEAESIKEDYIRKAKGLISLDVEYTNIK